MTKLSCTADTCSYNQDQSCCKSDIMIHGQDAQSSETTSCASFTERREGASNSMRTPNESLDVGCVASNCVHCEDDCKCTADTIGISGSNATHSRDTECSSFRTK